MPTDTRDPEQEQQLIRAVEKVLADEATRSERVKQAEARLPEIAPPAAEDVVRETEGELYRAIGRLLVRGVAIAARVVQLGGTIARIFS